jgi:hypothetical protein
MLITILLTLAGVGAQDLRKRLRRSGNAVPWIMREKNI